MGDDEHTSSDVRIGEAAITLVMQNQLSDVRSQAWKVPSLSPVTQEVQNQQEKKVVKQIAEIICMIGDKMINDKELNNAIDEVTSGDCARIPERFWKVVSSMFSDGEINWGRIALLIYMAGRIAVQLIENKLVKLIERQVPPIILALLKHAVSFFKTKLLCWVQENGGWINCFSELARQVNILSSMNTEHSRLIAIFVLGLPIVAVITWRVLKGT